jgi:hypothetical protein
MIRNVVVHINNEQPILVDLVAEPTASDVALVCRNVRSLSGKKPVFVNSADSTFVIPLVHVRVVELPRESLEAFATENEVEANQAAEAAETARTEAAGEEPEYSDMPLARLAWLTGGGVGPGPAAAGDSNGGAPEAVPANPDDLDDDLLRRIREV